MWEKGDSRMPSDIRRLAFWAYAGLSRFTRRKNRRRCYGNMRLLLFAGSGKQDDEEPGNAQAGQGKIGRNHAPLR